MIILDTDHVSLLQHLGSEEGERLMDRMAASSDGNIVTTVVTLEEQMRGWLQAIARHSTIPRASGIL
jgi:tRNA(fMet)-specific endonuclease VapC